MFPQQSALSATLRHEQLLAEASQARLLARVARRRPPPLRERVAHARRAVGYRLVEVGLNLVTGAAPAADP
jgi:hypothetical protein